MRHYTDVKATDAEVVAKFYELLNQKAVCDYFGYKSNSQIQTILKRNGIDVKKVREEVRLKRYKEYRDKGMTYDQIARLEGLSKDRVKHYCQHNNLGYSEDEIYKSRLKGAFKPSVNWQDRLDEIYGVGNRELIKVERQADGESVITNRCTKCGVLHTASSVQLRRREEHIRTCISCQKIETERRKRNESLDRQEAAERERRHNRKIVQLAFPMCTKCGMLVPKGHTVCEECKHDSLKENYRKKDIKRRAKLREVKRDKDITLRKLYERDNGICYLCGRVCEWSDSEYIDGAFVVGGSYPTVEHIKPISLGGTDTWDNIKLACHYCNSKKGNRIAI